MTTIAEVPGNDEPHHEAAHLVYRIKQPKVVVLIFSSGKLVVTGGKSPEECEDGVKIVRQQLENMGLL